MNKGKVVVAMSGGVDSSVAALLLKEQGYDVIGITLKLWTPSAWNNGEKYGGCCSPSDIAHAKQVCRQINAPHYTFDMEEKFKEKVVDNFISEYMDGKTPNPCVRCNSFIKFDALLKYVLAFEADYLATGHYARIHKEGELFRLGKAIDPTKDQSYFLYMLNQAQLSKLLFPVGAYPKKEVRELALKFGLVNALKEDSQDVCFLEGRGYGEFLKERVAEPIVKGAIRTKEGKVLGEHQGLPFYTIGQREGLGMGGGGTRLYVIEKDLKTNSLVVGEESQNLNGSCHVKEARWCAGAPNSEIKASVKIRYRHPGAMATIKVSGEEEAELLFDAPQSSITAGQSAVFYEGDYVLGGGVIS